MENRIKSQLKTGWCFKLGTIQKFFSRKKVFVDFAWISVLRKYKKFFVKWSRISVLENIEEFFSFCKEKVIFWENIKIF